MAADEGRRSGPPEAPPGVLARAELALRRPQVGDPDRAARAVETALERDPSALAGPGRVEALVDLAGASDWASRVLGAEPGLLEPLCSDPHAMAGKAPEPTHAGFLLSVRSLIDLAGDDTEVFDRELRRLRTREALRIALRELRGADVRHTARELSDLAGAALEGALAHHRARLEAAVGPVTPPCRALVVGLGKLGGEELNFSSDIDVLYVYEHDDGQAGALSSHEFHVRLFERVTSTLSRLTESGRVCRVDIDLRPEGRTGPLCNSLASLERYYETWGQPWERAAWIKARPVAGDLELFDEVLAFARPFVYRSTRDLAVVEGVLAMKAKIDKQQRRVGKSSFDVKLGRGGIREIEFFAQGQQLLYGGRDHRLRSGNTLEALHALEVAGHVGAKARARLADAYLFLRTVEHRIQLVDDRQTHAVPEGAARAAIARSLGFGSGDGLADALRIHTTHVHHLFTGLLGQAQDDPPAAPEVLLLLDPELGIEAKRAAVEGLGFREPEKVIAALASAARLPRSPFHPAASERGHRLAAQLLADCLSSPEPERALEYLPVLLRSALAHGAYFEKLERPDLRRGVARALGASDLLARIVVSSPDLLTDVLFSAPLPPVAAVAGRVAELTDPADIEGSLHALRTTKQRAILRVALAELAGAVPPEEVWQRSSRLAEALLGAGLELALADMSARYGPPEDPEAALVLLAGGTLGAEELGYRSDVDLTALYLGQGETRGAAKPPITISEYFTRGMQRFLSYITLRTPQGDLYPVDLRLRPSGSQGPLVASLDSFERYHARGHAARWEKQALVRTRTIVGPEAARARVEAALEQATYGGEHRPEDAAEIHAMRQRLGERRRRADRWIDLKFGPGGILEAEFLVQHLLLLHGGSDRELRGPSTREALRRLGAGGHIPSRTAHRVARAHRRLRRALDWLRLIHDQALDGVGKTERELRPLALALGYEGESAAALFAGDLEQDQRLIHRAYSEHVAQS